MRLSLPLKPAHARAKLFLYVGRTVASLMKNELPVTLFSALWKLDWPKVKKRLALVHISLQFEIQKPEWLASRISSGVSQAPVIWSGALL